MSTVRRYVIAGTIVPQPVANAYYAALANRAEAEILVLPHGGLGSVEATVDHMIDVLCLQEGTVELIGHSQGGLVAAMIAARCPEAVQRVITIGAPLGGSLWCRLPPLFPAMHDMSVPHPLCSCVDMVNIVGSHDKVVVPWTSGLIPGSVHHVVPTGHLGLVNHRSVLAIVAGLFGDAPTPGHEVPGSRDLSSSAV